MKTLRVEYILDTEGMTEPQKQAACRLSLKVIAEVKSRLKSASEVMS